MFNASFIRHLKDEMQVEIRVLRRKSIERTITAQAAIGRDKIYFYNNNTSLDNSTCPDLLDLAWLKDLGFTITEKYSTNLINQNQTASTEIIISW